MHTKLQFFLVAARALALSFPYQQALDIGYQWADAGRGCPERDEAEIRNAFGGRREGSGGGGHFY